MGEFMGNSGDNHTPDNITMGGENKAPEDHSGTAETPGGYRTDVENVRSDDVVKQGKDEFPCFDVSQEEFYQNMQDGRRRLRFKSGSAAQQYMQGSKYNRPFYVRHTDEKGKKYVRKIK